MSEATGLNYQQFWKNLGHRQTGTCTNGSRVVLFDSITDYSEYISANLVSVEQRLEVKTQLLTRAERFFSPRKRTFKCNYMFANFTRLIAENFGKRFIKPHEIILPNRTNGTRENVTMLVGTKNNNKTDEKIVESKQSALKPSLLMAAKSQSSASRVKRSIGKSKPSNVGGGGGARQQVYTAIQYPVIITCFVLSFVVFTGLFLALLL